MSHAHRALARYPQAKPDPESALITKHGSLIDRCARALALKTGMWAHYDDLWSAGALGLVEAARRYDKDQQVKFESFVEHRIRGAMLDELRRLDHLPRRLRARAASVQKARNELEQAQGEAPSQAEVAARAGVALEDVDEIEALNEPLLSIEGAPEPSADAQAFETLVTRDRVREVKEAISLLPERLQIVLALRYDEGFTYREIASIFEVSEPRISQLHSEAIKQLRRALGA